MNISRVKELAADILATGVAFQETQRVYAEMDKQYPHDPKLVVPIEELEAYEARMSEVYDKLRALRTAKNAQEMHYSELQRELATELIGTSVAVSVRLADNRVVKVWRETDHNDTSRGYVKEIEAQG